MSTKFRDPDGYVVEVAWELGVSVRQTVGAEEAGSPRRSAARGVTLAGMNNGIARASESAWRTTISDKTG